MSESSPLSDEPVALTVTSRELLAEGRIVTLVRESFEYNDVPTAREFVVHPGAVAVAALDADNRVLLIKQYRHPVRSKAWELPAGLLDVEGEPYLEAAKRELAEEVDLVASDWSVMFDITASSGSSNEVVRIFLARGLSAAEANFEREAEEADIEIRWVPLADAVAAVLAGSIRNSILVAGVLAVAAQQATAPREHTHGR